MATHVAAPFDGFGDRNFSFKAIDLHPVESVGLESVVAMTKNNIQKAVIVEITYPGRRRDIVP